MRRATHLGPFIQVLLTYESKCREPLRVRRVRDGEIVTLPEWPIAAPVLP